MGKWARRRDTSPKGMRPPTLWSSKGFAEEYQKRVGAGVRSVRGGGITDLARAAVVGLLLWKRLRY